MLTSPPLVPPPTNRTMPAKVIVELEVITQPARLARTHPVVVCAAVESSLVDQ